MEAAGLLAAEITPHRGQVNEEQGGCNATKQRHVGNEHDKLVASMIKLVS